MYANTFYTELQQPVKKRKGAITRVRFLALEIPRYSMPPPIIGVFRRGNLPAQALKAWLAQIDSEKSGEITSEQLAEWKAKFGA